MKYRIVSLLAMVSAVSSCGVMSLGKTETKPAAGPNASSGMPPQLIAKSGDAGTPVLPGGNIPAASTASLFTPQSDIIYTNPDDPDAVIPELATVLDGPKRGPWEESETIAKQRAIREGKPMLIWFTSSQNSPMCKALSQELFATNDFGNWATENLVRLRIDDFVKITDPNMSIDDATSRELDIKDYNAKLKKRYKVLGYPTLIVLSPNGEVVGRYRGYKRGDSKFLWGQLKQARVVSDIGYKVWRADMEKKGYREWQDRRDRKIFARLISYSKGELVMVEPGGNYARTQETSLSDKDRAWIAEQKKLRNIN